MVADESFFKMRTLELFMGKSCTIAFRDWEMGGKTRRIHGKLINYDEMFQTWEISKDPERANGKYIANFPHRDINLEYIELK